MTVCAISFETVTYNDLCAFMGNKIIRVDPIKFLEDKPLLEYHYINLVTKFPARADVSRHLDAYQCQRFSYIADDHDTLTSYSPGIFIYPGVHVYPGSHIGKDVLIHSGTVIAHGATIGPGTFISINVSICGSADVGENCWIGANSTVIDHIKIANQCMISAGSVVHKDIAQPEIIFINGRCRHKN